MPVAGDNRVSTRFFCDGQDVVVVGVFSNEVGDGGWVNDRGVITQNGNDTLDLSGRKIEFVFDAGVVEYSLHFVELKWGRTENELLLPKELVDLVRSAGAVDPRADQVIGIQNYSGPINGWIGGHG